MKKIAIIGANLPLLPFYEHARKLGYEIHSFAWDEGAVCKEIAHFFYPISFTEKEKIAHLCMEMKIEGVTSFSLESALPTVNYVSRFIGKQTNSETCEYLSSNKYSMRECFKKASLSIPQFKIVYEEFDLDNIIMEFPLIVKPIDSGGSRGVTKVENKSELIAALYRAKKYSKAEGILVEQFIEGNEYSVEYISYLGKHYFVAITQKKTTGSPFFVELEHHQPAIVTNRELFEIKKLTIAALDALNFEFGPSHTEVKINSSGKPYIIEIGPRMGGDMITSDLVKLSTGYDFIEAVIELSSGNFIEPKQKFLKYSGIYYLSAETRHVERFIRNKYQFPEIVKAELFKNDIIEINESNDRAGYFIYQAAKPFLINDYK